MPGALDPEFLARLARWVELAAALTSFGTLVVAGIAATSAAADRNGPSARAGLPPLLRSAIGIGVAATIAWLPLQGLRMASGEARWFDTTLVVATQTTFGQAILARSALLIAALTVAGDLRPGVRTWLAMALAGSALALQPWLGHPAAAGDWQLPLLVSVHVVAAGTWIGALLPLALLLGRLPVEAAADAARRFSRIGIVAVLAIAVTAILQSPALVGDVGGWFGTPYGLLAIAKIAGFLVLLAIAALNRFWLVPRLASAKRGLLISIAGEAVVGALVIAAAAALASQPPGAHEQAVWPFAVQPDLTRIDEPYFAKELWRGATIAGLALAGVAALLWRRTRLIGPLAAALAIALLPLPNLALLAKPSWPTSFHRSETGFTAASILQGEALLRQHCTPDCFRPRDDPSDPSSYGLWQRGDGDLYGWLTSVFDRIGHSPFQHGTISALPPRQRWQLIDYFRARVAGTAAQRAGAWRFPILTPDFPLHCIGGETSIRELGIRRVPVEIIVAANEGELPPTPALNGEPLIRILLSLREPSSTTAGIDCFSTSPDARAALALMAGLHETRLDGVRFLADANGWLRSRRLPAHPEGSGDPGTTWQAEFRQVAQAPFEAGGIGTHRH